MHGNGEEQTSTEQATANARMCFDCRFFSTGRLSPLTEKDWDEALPGECRRYPPQIGDMVKNKHGDEEHWFGEFPKVMAGEWCGEFAARGE